ncbi:MAG: DUF4359 domain-containing protein [Cyanobacteriota bacterium]|jgi:hypothetical protein|nr:DUF4359 domain-containing protein [Cyanobacteriota bacterium]
MGIGLGVATVAGFSAGLVATNPNPQDFERFAAQRLTAEVSDKICNQEALPMVLQSLVGDCTLLVRSQGPVLGRLARDHSQRWNLGLLSLYTTEVGGQELPGGWRLPRYRASTLAVAGQFLLLETAEVQAGGRP